LAGRIVRMVVRSWRMFSRVFNEKSADSGELTRQIIVFG